MWRNMVGKDIIIAIDPDVNKSGVATLHIKSLELEISAMDFPTLVEYLQLTKFSSCCGESKENVLVIVEAGWLNKSNWHLKRGENARTAAAKGNAAGRNHETGRKIIEMSEYIGMETLPVRPLRKCWRGEDGKITHEELQGIVGGRLPNRTSQDMRDAALLAWVHAGLPIRINKHGTPKEKRT